MKTEKIEVSSKKGIIRGNLYFCANSISEILNNKLVILCHGMNSTKESYLQEMGYKIREILKQKDIPNDIILRTQTITTIYKKIKKGYRLENIYDLFYLKLLVEEIEECYQTLCIVHSMNPPINGRFKDYIFNPRTNLYQSLHTTVSDTNGKLIKVKIRTFDMDKVAAFGIPALWNIRNPKTLSEKIQWLKLYDSTDLKTELTDKIVVLPESQFLNFVTKSLPYISHKQLSLAAGNM
mgnify:CR=1 FL=1